MSAVYQTLNDVFTDVRYNSGKDSTLLSNTDLTRIANKYYYLLLRELIDINEDFYAEISSTDLVSSQREYPLPTDSTSSGYGGGLIKLQRVEVTYDNTNWYIGTPISPQTIPGPITLDTDLNQIYDKSAPVYWYKDRSLFLAPVPGTGDYTTAGNANLRIFWIKRKNELVATTDVPDIPKDFLAILTEGMLIDVFRQYGRIADMQLAMKNWQEGLVAARRLEANPEQDESLRFTATKKIYR